MGNKQKDQREAQPLCRGLLPSDFDFETLPGVNMGNETEYLFVKVRSLLCNVLTPFIPSPPELPGDIPPGVVGDAATDKLGSPFVITAICGFLVRSSSYASL